ncbi:MAG: aspartate carbamoyltransferase catalytic subunit [Nitrospirae bacterium]|jgi:aspartate carbamoyltransferase catalytic subunit|nr:aspartate carbamoyltransferase catalytic subunit [Nitrospirota bacterium]
MINRLISPEVPAFGPHLLSVVDLSPEVLTGILDTAESFLEVGHQSVKKVPVLRGKTLVNLFYESSTRTRSSFEIAAKRLSADVINISTTQSSVTKGESLIDTVRTIEALGADGVVIRHPSSGAPAFVSSRVGCHVINGGDGCHQHPTQALLDLFTIRRKLGRIGGLTVAIIGDILHSRVARSNITTLSRMGARVRLVAPPTLLPRGIEDWPVEIFHSLEKGIEGCDVVMALRLQLERAAGGFIPSVAEYARLYGLNAPLLERVAPGALVMHPGPVNRGIEISGEEEFTESSAILSQVEFGVSVRMAVLYLLMGGGPEEVLAGGAVPDKGGKE